MGQNIQCLPDLITIMDTEHRVVKVNKAMADSVGVSPEEIVGKIVMRWFTEPDVPLILVHILTSC